MRFTLPGLFGAALLACLPGAALAQPAGTASAALAARLVEMLGSADYREREDAARQLEGAPDALTALRAALRHPSAETRRRAAVLVERLERRALTEPTRVTIRATDKPVLEVVQAIAAQAGVDVRPATLTARRVSVNLDGVPFWDAIEEVQRQSGCTVADQGDGGLVVSEGEADAPPGRTVGPFRVSALSVTLNRTLTLSAAARRNPGFVPLNEQLSLAFSVSAEPKVPLLGMGQPVLLAAVDDRGDSRLPQTAGGPSEWVEAHYHRQMFRQTQQQGVLALGRGARDGGRLRLLRARVPLTLLGKQRPDAVIDIAPKQKAGRASGRVAELELHDLSSPVPGLFTVTASVRQLGQPDEDGNWASTVAQRLELADAQGRRYQSMGISNFMEGGAGRLRATFQFTANAQKLGPPARLTYVEWVPQAHELVFELRDVPLP